MSKTEKLILIIFGSIYSFILLLTILIHLKKIVIPKVSFRKILKINLFVFLIVSILTLSLNYINFLDYEKPIPYKEVERISFENFRGFEFFKKELYGNKHFAYVYTTINLDAFNDEALEINSYFHPSRSFVYDKKSRSSDLLTHEIYHFKITEIFARKVRKEIILNNIRDKSKIEEIISKNIILENKFQKEYDYDTFHSYVLKEQKKYEKTIDSILNSLNKYKNSNIKLYEK